MDQPISITHFSPSFPNPFNSNEIAHWKQVNLSLGTLNAIN